MQAPDPIEAALARLMPTALSVSGQRSIEDMLDELAAELPAPAAARWHRPAAGFAAAAAVSALIALPALFKPAAPVGHGPVATVPVASPASKPAEVQWLEESDRVESMADEGWVANSDGAAMQAVRVHMVGENTLRDPETGYTVRISEPRSELLLMPVSSF